MERTTYPSFWSNELLQIYFNLNWFVSYSEFQEGTDVDSLWEKPYTSRQK